MTRATVTRGRRVELRRRDLGLSQEKLARLCDCSAKTIQRIEADKHPHMSQPMIEALHRSLGMPLGELLATTRKAGAR